MIDMIPVITLDIEATIYLHVSAFNVEIGHYNPVLDNTNEVCPANHVTYSVPGFESNMDRSEAGVDEREKVAPSDNGFCLLRRLLIKAKSVMKQKLTQDCFRNSS